MDYASSPFHKFTGWKIWALIGAVILYSLWFTHFGPWGKLAGLAPGMPLEARGFYTGAQAVETLSQLDAAGRRTKFLWLLCDIPYMIMSALVFEALIAFGIRRMALTKPIWSVLFILPIAFLLADFSEDSFIALTLVTQSELFGSIAGVMTFMKMLTYMAAALTGLLMSLAGLVVWLRKGGSKPDG